MSHLNIVVCECYMECVHRNKPPPMTMTTTTTTTTSTLTQRLFACDHAYDVLVFVFLHIQSEERIQAYVTRERYEHDHLSKCMYTVYVECALERRNITHNSRARAYDAGHWCRRITYYAIALQCIILHIQYIVHICIYYQHAICKHVRHSALSWCAHCANFSTMRIILSRMCFVATACGAARSTVESCGGVDTPQLKHTVCMYMDRMGWGWCVWYGMCWSIRIRGFSGNLIRINIVPLLRRRACTKCGTNKLDIKAAAWGTV